LNKYSYVRNNPLRYIDPTGHGPEEVLRSAFQWLQDMLDNLQRLLDPCQMGASALCAAQRQQERLDPEKIIARQALLLDPEDAAQMQQLWAAFQAAQDATEKALLAQRLAEMFTPDVGQKFWSYSPDPDQRFYHDDKHRPELSQILGRELTREEYRQEAANIIQAAQTDPEALIFISRYGDSPFAQINFLTQVNGRDVVVTASLEGMPTSSEPIAPGQLIDLIPQDYSLPQNRSWWESHRDIFIIKGGHKWPWPSE
jgi:hypothetical protein